MLEAVVDVHLPGVDPGHSAFQAARAELLEDLGTAPALRPRERDLPADDSSKGSLVGLVVSVSTFGTAASLVKIARVWLERDRRRSLTVTIRTTGTPTTYEVSGDGSLDTLRDVLETAIRAQAAADAASQEVHAGRDALVAGRDIINNYFPEGPSRG